MPQPTFRIQYFKRRRTGQEPARYTAKEKAGKVSAIITLDPVLKQHPDLKRAIIAHEKREVKDWAEGSKGSHTKARKKEPKLLRKIGGVSGFWREIKKREKKKGK